MLHIAGGIILAILLICFWPYILVFALGIGALAIALCVCVAIFLAFYYESGATLAVLTFAGFVMILSLAADYFDKKKEIEKNRKARSLSFSHGDFEILERESRVSGKLRAFERNQVKAIGGMRLWFLDIYKRSAPAISVAQKVKKRRYIEIERAKLLSAASTAAKIVIETTERDRYENLSNQSRIKNAAETRELEDFSENYTRTVNAALKSGISKLKRKFNSFNNIVFAVGDNESFITVFQNNIYFSSYRIFAEASISKVAPSKSIMRFIFKYLADDYNVFTQYYIVDCSDQKLILSTNKLSDAIRCVKDKIITDAARAQMSKN